MSKLIFLARMETAEAVTGLQNPLREPCTELDPRLRPQKPGLGKLHLRNRPHNQVLKLRSPSDWFQGAQNLFVHYSLGGLPNWILEPVSCNSSPDGTLLDQTGHFSCAVAVLFPKNCHAERPNFMHVAFLAPRRPRSLHAGALLGPRKPRSLRAACTQVHFFGPRRPRSLHARLFCGHTGHAACILLPHTPCEHWLLYEFQ